MRQKDFAIIYLLIIILTSCTASQIEKTESTNLDIPKADREFRGAWVATVANINWPSKKNLTSEEQQKEAIFILDKLKSNNFNAVIFQARPQCDALYKSDLEPWSYFLTGQQGKAPSPYYDPLKFWIDEAHKRGIELHVWLNPYRAHHSVGGEITNQSIVSKHPDWVVKLKNGYWWLDPAKIEVQDHSFNVVMDLVKRYDLDGVHFDDYFYPYPSYNDNQDFPDDKSWNEYEKNGGSLTKSDWRRTNINTFIERVYKGIKSVKPNVKFGLSPFGIWRPGYPNSISGFDQHEQLFADAKLWINKGWVDYWSPQLYWKIGDIRQSFPVLVGWWKDQNLLKRHFWPGISIDRENNELNNQEVVNQIMTIRGMLPSSMGNICWSVGPILNYNELDSMLINGPYKKQALVPETPWFSSPKIEPPKISIKKESDKIKISWSHNNPEKVFSYVVYYKHENKWDYTILTNDKNDYELPLQIEYKTYNEEGKEISKKYNINEVGVSAVDFISKESEPALYKLN